MTAQGMKADCIAKRLEINGIVQGVGFRPFIYQLASRYGLRGEIANTSSGVSLHIEGTENKIESFSRDLAHNHPPLAHITDVSVLSEELGHFKDFSIAESVSQEAVSTLISPDVSICEDCLRELFDPVDRRYGYPFINCTNCGPRYTIIDNIPYDRPNSSMKHFRMCEKCQAEYDDPGDRRFHAQPNACADCGPRVSLHGKNGIMISCSDPLEQAANLLKEGRILAIKGLGGFHLAVDAEDNEAVCRLRETKFREEKPLALMAYDLERIRTFALIHSEEEILLRSPQRPIVLLRKLDPNPLSEEISPRNSRFGVMLPYTPLHYLILSHGFRALVMTSGNISDEPIAIDNYEAFTRLSGIADYFLTHDRDIYLRSDDSIVMRSRGETRLLRRSRGYVPAPIFLRRRVPQILACGAELKNTVCLTKGKNAFLSQHLGDLENLAAYDFFKMTIDHMKRILDIDPKIIACDLHPDYLSTRFALEQEDIQNILVQHHHAHIAACMAENGLEGRVIGLSFDGTGYGTDGSIWGGEVLIAGLEGFSRAASISETPMPGGNKAIKEPWRMGLSYLQHTFGEDLWDLDLPMLKEVCEEKVKVVLEMISKDINSPPTSSLGRFFDGVAAILGIREKVYYEGQAAMELEDLAATGLEEYYDYEWDLKDIYRVDPRPIIRGLVRDMEKGVDLSVISGRFHMTIIQLFTRLCEIVGAEAGLNRVALSGGVFQNSILLDGLVRTLQARGLEVYTHKLIPTNDGGISLGQAVVAAATTEY